MRYWLLLFVISLFIQPTTAQDQIQTIPLPASEWYAVAWNPADDTLNWLTSTGTSATIPRPALLGEANSAPRISISPDGRSMVMIVDLVDGRQSIGFYQFATGEYVQIHQTEVGERVADFNSSISSIFYNNRVALTLATNTSWRIISFDASTGDPIDILNHNAPLAGVIPNVGGGILPYLMHHTFDASLNSHAIHFQISARETIAFVWYPEAQSLEPSNLTIRHADIRYNTTDALFIFNNMTYPLPPVNSVESGGNAIGNGEPINPITIYADGNSMKSRPRWLAGGAWVGFYSQSAGQSPNWQVFANDGQSTAPITLASDVANIVGTPNGFLAVHTDGRITHANALQPVGVTIYQSEQSQTGNLPQIVGVTPRGVSHLLTQIEAFHPPDNVIETFIPECDDAPESRLQIGDEVRVISSVPLKMRNVAGGNQVAEIPINTSGQIINGAVCANRFLWWQVRWTLPNGQVLEGWSAEGSQDEYFLTLISDMDTETATEVETETEITPDETFTEQTPVEQTPVTSPTLPSLPYVPPTVTPSMSGDG